MVKTRSNLMFPQTDSTTLSTEPVLENSVSTPHTVVTTDDSTSTGDVVTFSIPDEFHDSRAYLEEEEEEEEDSLSENVTLELLYHQIKLWRSELYTKLDHVKEDLYIQVENKNSDLRNEIEVLKKHLQEKDNIIQSLRDDVDKIKNKISNTVTRDELESVERDVIDVQQYNRRNNVEISGLPEELTDLQDTVINIGKAIGVQIKPDDIQAAHRLRKDRNHRGPRKIIARFVNRKTAESLIRSSKQFKHRETVEKAGLRETIFINNSLSNYSKYLWGKAKSLKRKNLINKFWCYNGTVNVLINDHDDPIKIRHINDLIKLFPDDELWA